MAKKKPKYSDEFLALVKSVKAKRPRTVIEHILKHGQVTTDELKQVYGYNHPPRAARDVREQGIPLKTVYVRGPDNRRMAAYTFADPSEAEHLKLGGRKAFSKAFKEELVALQGEQCGICGIALNKRYLQIDHRVPFEVAGEGATVERETAAFLLVCGSCNRAKSWSCEHCENLKDKDESVCVTCYWANPVNHRHVAMLEVRRLDVVWSADEVADHELLAKLASAAGQALPEFVKKSLRGIVRPANGNSD